MPEDKQIEYIVSTLSIENLKASDEAIRMCREMGKGKIGMNEALTHILAYHGISSGIRNGK